MVDTNWEANLSRIEKGMGSNLATTDKTYVGFKINPVLYSPDKL